MTIRRRCTERTCKNGRRCLEHLRFDVMWRGKRYRMPVNEYAIPRMEPGRQRPIQSMEEARLGTPVHRRDQGRTRSNAASRAAQEGQDGDRERVGVPGRL